MNTISRLAFLVLALVILTSCAVAPVAQPQTDWTGEINRSLEAAKAEIRTEFQGQIETLKAQNDELKGQIESLKNDNASLVNQIADLQSADKRNEDLAVLVNQKVIDTRTLALTMASQSEANAGLRSYAMSKNSVLVYNIDQNVKIDNNLVETVGAVNLYSAGKISGFWMDIPFEISTIPGDSVNLYTENGTLYAAVIHIYQTEGDIVLKLGQ